MCGIWGILRLTDQAPPIDREELRRTGEALAQRGPDGEGEWLSPDGRLAFGHRRLAVIDLSPAAAQPMAWGSGRYRLTYNGEIYNYRELRRELRAQGVPLATASDSEVILALYARLGTGMLPKLRGMYALALWDEAEESLLLARDPYGIKPLYYSVQAGTLRFASQVQALEAGGGISAEVDPAGLAGFLLWGSVPEPRTIRREVKALPAGSWLQVCQGQVSGPVPHFQPGASPPAEGPSPDPVAALADSVRAHLVADVPVALFLSAGLDSGLLAALACRALAEPPTTFTLRFRPFAGTSRDEGPLAARVAAALGTRHAERWVEAEEFRQLFPAALRAMDQPSIDGFNTFAVSRLAREAGLKVVLSGLGGDEIFGGYSSFCDVPRWAAWSRRLGRLPGLRAAWPALARGVRPTRPKLAGLLAWGGSLPGAYFLRRGLFLPEELPSVLGPELAAEGLAACDPLADAARHLPAGAGDPFLAVHRLETGLYLRNQLLRDGDWASMAHGLELRLPLVDPRLTAALAAGGFEPARSRGKAALVRRAAPELPEEVFRRPKSGFGIPVLALLDSDLATGSQGLDSRRLALRVLAEKGLLPETAPGLGGNGRC